ncbi:MAG: hypothetical protein ACO3DQ_01585 [Cephaloticoccus sp.]
MPAPAGFSYRRQQDGAVALFHHGRPAATLRHRAAEEFLDEVTDLDDASAQELMARLTGNYKRGNEGRARDHFRNRPD